MNMEIKFVKYASNVGPSVRYQSQNIILRHHFGCGILIVRIHICPSELKSEYTYDVFSLVQ